MSNFLRRLIRTKSRSNSPQKELSSHFHCAQVPAGTAAEWTGGTIGKQQKNPLMANHFGEAAGGGGGTHCQQQPKRATAHRQQTAAAVDEKLCVNSIPPRPPSHMSSVHHQPLHASPDSAHRLFANPDEPGTSSQEFLSPTLWPNSPTPWSMRNSHSNLDSSAESQRPSTHAAMQANEESHQRMASMLTLSQQQRPRSSSPRNPAGSTKLLPEQNVRPNFRSRSPAKKGTAKTKDYLLAQCQLEGCSATILVEVCGHFVQNARNSAQDTRFLVCKHQLSHASDFFRSLFLNTRALPLEGVRQTQTDEYVIQVSSLRHPPQALQFQWFLETSVPSPILRDVSDELLETCMRLCKRFAARGLEMRCTRQAFFKTNKKLWTLFSFIQQNVESKPPMMALCWLNWSPPHGTKPAVHEACLPVVARLSLQSLEKHRQMVPEAVFADLLAMKLRTAYQQASIAFHTIHRMGHFHVEMERCPRCGRQREQGRIRVQVSPCHKLIGCERCMRDFVCELEGSAELQAYWQCEHGLWPFSARTECCRCQLPLYRANRARAGEGTSTMAPPDMPRHRRKNSSNPNSSSKPSSSASRS
ncbi:hypothetical protein GPALN_012726 [Globodera pallida]|nr:hypothetical protein GPALN_012726 [Globodera pallida]